MDEKVAEDADSHKVDDRVDEFLDQYEEDTEIEFGGEWGGTEDRNQEVEGLSRD